MLIKGKAIAENLNLETARLVSNLKNQNITPHLGVVLVGNDRPSLTYVKKNGQLAEKLGIKFDLFNFDENISQEKLLSEIKDIQEKNNLSGLIIQLPIPEHLYTPEILNAVNPDIDIDCLTNQNIGKLMLNNAKFTPPTPQAVLEILKSLDLDLDNLKSKNVTIIGAGALVGKPLAAMLINAKASVATCNSSTKNTKQKCLDADIIITGVGTNKFLVDETMVHKDSIVIDTGIWFDNDNKMHGDVDYKAIQDKVAHVTPTPGGVGPITVACLLRNVVISAQNK